MLTSITRYKHLALAALVMLTSCEFSICSRNALIDHETPAIPFSDQPIFVGQSSVLHGALLPYQRAINNGICACFKEVNEAGGIYGRKIHLKLANNKNDAAQAVRDIKRFYNDSQIDLFLGNTGSRNILAALPLARKKESALLFPWGSNIELENRHNPYLIHAHSATQAQIRRLVEYITQELHHRNIGIVHSNGDFGKSNANYATSLLKRHGITPQIVSSYNSKTLRVGKTVEALNEHEPRVIMFLAMSKPTSNIIKKIIAQDSYTTDFVGLDSTQLVPHLLAHYNTPFAYSSTVPNVDEEVYPVVKAYRTALAKYLPDETASELSLMYYINAHILVHALKETVRLGNPVTAHHVIRSLEQIRSLDLGGFISNFDQRSRTLYPLTVSMIKERGI